MRNAALDKFERDGYLIIDNFFMDSEINEMMEAGKRMCFEAPKEERKIFSTIDASACQNRDSYFLDSANKISYFFENGAVDNNNELLVAPELALNKVGHALHIEHSVFRKYTFDDRIREICWQLGFNRPAVAQSMYIYKNPGIGGEVTSHQDGTYLFSDPPTTVGFWIALEDSTVENGCLKFIRASHNNGIHRRYIRNPDKTSNELVIYDRPAPIYQSSNFTSTPVSKGALVAIHSQVVHRSEENKSNKSRHAYTFHVVETKNTVYSQENWLQPPIKGFPILYEK